MERVVVGWSGGKDSALALAEILQGRRFEVAALLTTVTRDYDRISMHGVRRALLHEQARSLGLPLQEVFISRNATNEEYEAAMAEALAGRRAQGITQVVFGDIFLEDLRKYREERLALADMRPLFPIWKRDTTELLRSFMSRGFKAITTCVDTKVLSRDLAGREIDERFLADLPPGADPCGENGEYHTFVYNGPLFRRPVRFTLGEKVLREDRFYYCDLVEPGETAAR